MKKITVALIMTLLSLVSKAETPEQIMKYIQNRQVEKVVSCSTYPFTIEWGLIKDHVTTSSPETLRRRLRQLYKDEDWSGGLKGKIKSFDHLTWGFEVRDYNKAGELESESTLNFTFKKTKEGYKLCKIWMAG